MTQTFDGSQAGAFVESRANARNVRQAALPGIAHVMPSPSLP